MASQFHEAPFSNVLRVTFNWTSGGAPAGGSRLFFLYTKPSPTSSQLQTLVDAAHTSWVAHWAALTAINVSLSTIEAVDLDTISGAFADNVQGAAGGLAGTELPLSCCLVINHRTAQRYRGGHPKNFWVAGNATETTNGRTWIGTFLQSATTSWSGLIADLASAVPVLNLIHVAASYYKGHMPDPTPTTWGTTNVPMPRDTPSAFPIINFSPSSVIGQQRRRLTLGG